MVRSKPLRFAGVMCLMAVPLAPAYAQEEPGGRYRASSLEEVVVTARRVAESLQDTPVSVSAFSQKNLQQMGVTEVGQVARFTPNLQMNKQAGNNDNYGISLRGTSQMEPSLAAEPTVGVYLDGVYLARQAGMAFDIVDLERIEVLRGPQGSLFGRNTIGGAINIITEKPRGEFAFKQQITQYNRGHNYRTSIDTPSLGDFAAKLSYARDERDGEFRSVRNGRELGYAAGDAAHFALSWTPGDTFRADYSFDWSRRESSPQIIQISHLRDLHGNPASAFYGGAYYDGVRQFVSDSRLSKLPTILFSGEDRYSDSNIDHHALTLEWQANPDLTIKSISSYREWDRVGGTDAGHFPAPADGSLCPVTAYSFLTGSCAQPVPAGQLVGIFTADARSAQRQSSQEFQFIGSLLDSRLNYTAGLYYFEERGDESSAQTLVLPAALQVAGTPLAPLSRGKSLFVSSPFFRYATDNESYAVYGEFEYALTEALDVTLGMRYTEDSKETTLTNVLTATSTSPRGSGTLQTIKDDNTWSNFTPALTVTYRVDDDVSVYGKVTTGYRAGGYNVRATNVQAFKNPFDEENLTSWEMGWKTEWLDQSLRFNGAIFYVEYEDQQVAQFEAGSGGASNNIVNAGESTVTGLELELTWLPTAGLTLSGSYGYQDTDYKSFVTAGQNQVTGLPTGTNIDASDIARVTSPRNSATFSAMYEFPEMSWGVISLRADAAYTGKQTFGPILYLYDAADSYTLVNARASLASVALANGMGELEVALWGRNLTNEKYREFGIDFGQLGFAVNNYGNLASYGVDIIYTFNR